jgi:multidrug resistance efflux pump
MCNDSSVDSDNNQTEEPNMTMENAILELAAAIRYAADKTSTGGASIAKLIENVASGPAMISDAELETAVTKVETDAKAKQQAVMAAVEADRKPTAARAAIETALANARAEKVVVSQSTIDEVKQVSDEQDARRKSAKDEEDDRPALGAAVAKLHKEAAALKAEFAAATAPLDWGKDVRPALLAVGKDLDALVKLMTKYDVPKGGKAPTEKWADLLAEANAIVAARG